MIEDGSTAVCETPTAPSQPRGRRALRKSVRLGAPQRRVEDDRVALAKSGCGRAQAELVRALWPRLERMAKYYGRRCGEDADDLLQEAWLGVLDSLPHVDLSIGSPEQHLIQRARWRLLDAVKRARVRRCASLEAEMLCDEVGTPVETAIGKVTADEFTGRLNPTQVRVLECLMGGLTWREAGAVLGCSSANIAYHVRQIRQRYTEYAGDER